MRSGKKVQDKELIWGVWNLVDFVQNSQVILTEKCLTYDLFLSFSKILSDVISGWYYDFLGWKFTIIFNWERKKTCFGPIWIFIQKYCNISSQNNVWKYRTEGHEQVLQVNLFQKLATSAGILSLQFSLKVS